MRGKRFYREFDFAGYFDQFEIPEELRCFFVIRVKEPIDGCTTFALTRLPMGATFAPGVAQMVTWMIVQPVLGIPGVSVHTMIDNVRIAANSRKAFQRAVDLFLQRVKQCGLQLNEDEASDPTKPLLFLGEQYHDQERVANAEHTVAKLDKAQQLFDAFCKNQEVSYTVRNLASLIGLVFFMMHTLEIHIADHYTLLRGYSRIITDALSTGNGKMSAWDKQVKYVSQTMKEAVNTLIGPLLLNIPVKLPVFLRPDLSNEKYDYVVIIDASKGGWAAYLQRTQDNSVRCITQRWTAEVKHSATAEPRAVTHCFKYMKEVLDIGKSTDHKTRIALVTDHDAIARGQLRWYSGFSGFSKAYDLNTAFQSINNATTTTEVFYVEGELNIADGPSRDVNTNTFIEIRDVDILFPSLTQFHHPYSDYNIPSHMV